MSHHRLRSGAIARAGSGRNAVRSRRDDAIEASRRLRREHLADGDPGDALGRAVRALVAARVGGLVAERGGPAVDLELVERGVRVPLLALLERAQRAGQLRSDVTVDALLESLAGILEGHLPADAASLDSTAASEVVSQVFLDAAGYRPHSTAASRRVRPWRV
ncbi:MAG: hypothetical protein QOJ47_1894 [Gaiellales bacterium]|nr:hypothetical protein [Gaiellales bacterium]